MKPWRKGWDLNPRYGITVYRISSPAHSTTLPPFQDFTAKCVDGYYNRIHLDLHQFHRLFFKNLIRPPFPDITTAPQILCFQKLAKIRTVESVGPAALTLFR